MVKIDRLPSGTYRARVNLGGGKYKTITGKDKKSVQLEAAQVEAGLDDKLKPDNLNANMTVGEAMDKYCESKKNVISPTTYREYKRKSETCLPELRDVKLHDLTVDAVQSAVNIAAEDLSPKSIRDIHGFLSAVIKQYYPEFTLRTTLPKKENIEIKIPSEDIVSKLFNESHNTVMELPIILAACCGMRKSEILGLKWTDVNFDKATMRISEARVIDIENDLVSKGTKTTASTRIIRLLPQVKSALQKYEVTNKNEYVVNLTPAGLYKRYQTMLSHICPNEHYRFHDLRHYAVSVMLSLNIPKKYIADFVGHETENMIDQVYGHIMREKKTEVEDILTSYYEKLFIKNLS